MNILPYSVNQNKPTGVNHVAFESRTKALREFDDISRRVINEFNPISNTKLIGFMNINATKNNCNYLGYIQDLMSKCRAYYKSSSRPKRQLLKEMSVIKDMKVGNCGEMADATYLALKLNGVKDAKILTLYAYNKNTQTMRELDHMVVGINFKLPKGYKYHQWCHDENFVSPGCRIYPQNDSIVVDSWAGFTEYGKNVSEKYSSNRALIMGHRGDLCKRNSLLYPDEELCFVPVEDHYKLKSDDLMYYEQTYPNLVLEKNKGKLSQKENIFTKMFKSLFGKSSKNIAEKKEFCFEKMSEKIKIELRYNRGLKGAPTEKEMEKIRQVYQDSINKKYKIKPKN